MNKQTLAKGAAALAAVGTVASIALIGGSASADPQQITNAFYGYGSDTIQDVTNAFAGYSNGVNFPELQTDSDTQVVSWDAFGSQCIVPAASAPQILRPNGSGNGQRILAAANVAGETWPLDGAPTACGPALGTSGFVDFSRSSSGPGSRQNDSGPLQWLPFGRDALSFAFAKPSGSSLGGVVTNLSSAELIALHDTGPQVIDGTPIIACGIQTGSGTYGTWMGDLGLSDDPPFGDAPGTALCNSISDPGLVDQDPTDGFRLQENNSPELILKANQLATISDPACDGVAGGAAVSCADAQLVIGFSASQFIARYNEQVGSPDSRLDSVNGGIGSVDSLGFPINATGGSGTVGDLAGDETLSPNGSYYADGNYGRDVYYIVPFNKIDPGSFIVDNNLRDMFVSETGPFEASKICAADSIIEQHGFLSLGSDCMVPLDSLRGDFRTS
ncbi:MAG: hypothetical protein AAFY28_08240 [Actinomycetota bacterium]